MYPKLLTAMKKHNITDKDIARVLNIPYTTVRDRTKGKYSFTFEQAILINKKLFPGYISEELFEPKE
ncbi:XRE family transcriptional regulator [Staphylococcus xylosus]|uniref:helix-turn-helix domain-containing protein n=1 Tax=Staphylococcus TaxID=1279 RepID=UPI0004F63C89|nr:MULTISPECIES: helix-turn-helix domain-containing protein [Staphylococcus]MBM6637459.1 helix-turn-helix domain-containing protein [Staphylococcus xylosus]MBU6132190.1 helix-turn-helix domain-containing protein [Staphylococcus xylosus]MEB7383758.1 helix-turn-helix domain-containing protein [Staphylococcus xylosus]MEB7659545.1 helix-turn-helix domain-containing protein [Staphylococcus xylosus]MEB7709509.1 helix-turn-helix domain-containing protein [Staphylococcus xylosus]